MPVRIACVVEGHGETEAVPILIRRIAERTDPSIQVNIPNPIRISRGKLLRPEQLERAVEFAARSAGANGGILVLLDSDADCPAELGPELLRRATKARGDLPIGVVLAKQEFEAWFLASAESLRGRRGLPPDLLCPVDPEGIRGAKEWLGQHIAGGSYSETVDQPALAAIFDLDAARETGSFDKCYREIERLLTALPSDDPQQALPES